MSTVVVLVHEDTAPPLVSTIRSRGQPVNLTGATVILRLSDGVNPTMSRDCTVLTPMTDGRVSVDWTSQEIPPPGSYKIEYRVTFAIGGTQTFPGTRPDKLKIRARL